MKRSTNRILWLGCIFTALNLWFFLLLRPQWIFINHAVALPKFMPFSFSVLVCGIMGIIVLYFVLLSALRVYTEKFKEAPLPKALLIIICVLEAFFLVLNIYVCTQLGNSIGEVPRRLLLSLPQAGMFAAVLFLTLIYPAMSVSKNKILKLFILFIIMIAAFFSVADLGQVRITSGPVLQRVDAHTTAVIWSTNYNSTGEVSYGPNAEHMKTAYEAEDGLIQADTKLHKVFIPADDISGFVYQTSSTKINNLYENNVEFGNTVNSALISCQPAGKDAPVSFLIFNDVHNNAQIYRDFLADGKYDFVVSNGDALTSAESADIIVRQFLMPIGDDTNGGYPFYFVRGNHETRGPEARNLKDYLALPDGSYYYTFTAGPVFAVVLDSGEDKQDEHEEYSGLVDFKGYKEEETKWLERILQSDEYKAAKYHIAFIHIPLNSYADQSGYLKESEAAWRQMLSDADIDVAFSGHTHKPQLVKPEEYNAAFPTVIGGGDAYNEKSYLAVKVEVSDEQMVVYYENINHTLHEILRITR